VTAQRYYVQKNLFSRKLRRCHFCIQHWQTVTIDNNANDVNETRPSVQLLAINILCYFVIKKWNAGLVIQVWWTASIWSFFIRFYNVLKFHILSRDGKMLGLSFSLKISLLSTSGHRTFVLSTINIFLSCDTRHLCPLLHINSQQWTFIVSLELLQFLFVLQLPRTRCFHCIHHVNTPSDVPVYHLSIIQYRTACQQFSTDPVSSQFSMSSLLCTSSITVS